MRGSQGTPFPPSLTDYQAGTILVASVGIAGQNYCGNGVCLPLKGFGENRLNGFSADDSYQRHRMWRGGSYV